MLVIIEGADGTGKTTLAKSVAGLVDAHVIHKSAPTRPGLIEYTEPLGNYGRGGFFGRHSVVCDRWHLGELVYGPLYRGGADLTDNEFAAVEDFLLARGAVLVFCTGRVRQLAQRIRARGEDCDETALARELAAFDAAHRRSRLPSMISPAGMEVTAEDVVEFARMWEEHVA